MKKLFWGRMLGVLAAVFLLALLPGQATQAAGSKVQNFRLVCNGNKSAFLGWDKVPKAKYYNLYRYEPSTQTYKLIQKTKATAYQVKGMTVGKKYHFVVRSVKGGTESADSEVVTAVGKKLNVAVIHGRYWTAKIKKNMTVTEKGTGTKIKVKAGTAVLTASGSGNKIVAMTAKGKTKFYCKSSNLKYGELWVTENYKYYSKEQAETYVNAKGYSSETGWLVWVSQYTASVHFFRGSKGKWNRVRIAPCVIGSMGRTTPGVFKMLRVESTHNKPQIYFTWNPEKDWGNSFHCRINSNSHGAYSDGCIRLGDSDLYYLRDNCPMGTTVVSY